MVDKRTAVYSIRSVLVILLVLLAALVAWIVFPWLSGSGTDTLVRATTVLVLAPLGLFFAIHPTAQLDKKKSSWIDLLLGLGGIAAVLALILLLRGIYVAGAISTMVSLIFLYFARRLWLRTLRKPKETIVEAGEAILAAEADPEERRKLSWALKRFKED
jgi:hypothetical protein